MSEWCWCSFNAGLPWTEHDHGKFCMSVCPCGLGEDYKDGSERVGK